MEPTSSGPIPPDTTIHRIGGGGVGNLRLKEKEESLDPPGISVFLGGMPDEAAEQIRQTFPQATRLLLAAERVGSATVEAIRQAGFDVIVDPTRHFANHARLIHKDGVNGFTETRLQALSQAFQDTIRSA